MSCLWLQHNCTQSWLIHILIQSYQSFHLDSVWLLDLHPNFQDLKTVFLRYMAFLEGTSMKFSTWNLAMWARIPKISPPPSAMTHHQIAPFQAYMWFAEAFKDPLKLVLNFCMRNCVYSTSSTNEVWPSNAHYRSKRVGLAIPSHKPDHLLGPCNTSVNTGSVLPSHCLPNSKCIFQTEIENLAFQDKNKRNWKIWAQNS